MSGMWWWHGLPARVRAELHGQDARATSSTPPISPHEPLVIRTLPPCLLDSSIAFDIIIGMAKKAVLLIPLTYNDGTRVPQEVRDEIDDALFILSGGHT